MNELKLQLIEVVEDLTKAKIKVVELEAKFAGLVDRLTEGSPREEERKTKFKRDAAPIVPRKSIQTKPVEKTLDVPGLDFPKSTKQKIVEALRAANGVPLSVAMLCDRASCATSHGYAIIKNMLDEGTVVRTADGYALASSAKVAV